MFVKFLCSINHFTCFDNHRLSDNLTVFNGIRHQDKLSQKGLKYKYDINTKCEGSRGSHKIQIVLDLQIVTRLIFYSISKTESKLIIESPD